MTYYRGQHRSHRDRQYFINQDRRTAERQVKNLNLPPRDCPSCGMPMSIDKDAGYVCENGRVSMECLKAVMQLRYGKPVGS